MGITYIANDRHMHLLCLDWRLGRGNVAEKRITGGLELSTFLLVPSRLAGGHTLSLLTDVGVVIVGTVAGAGATLGPE